MITSLFIIYWGVTDIIMICLHNIYNNYVIYEIMAKVERDILFCRDATLQIFRPILGLSRSEAIISWSSTFRVSDLNKDTSAAGSYWVSLTT